MLRQEHINEIKEESNSASVKDLYNQLLNYEAMYLESLFIECSSEPNIASHGTYSKTWAIAGIAIIDTEINERAFDTEYCEV